MANFKQHLSFGVIVTAALTSPLLAAGYVTTTQASLLWLCGIIGSIIPDVDSDTAFAQDLLFTGLTVFTIFTVLENYGYNRSGLEILLLIFGSLGAIQGVRLLFKKLSVHRGVFHSILGACFFGLLTCVTTWFVHQVPPMVAWLAALFMFIGVLLHLILDEIFSVDFMNMEIKKSFGSALKVTNFRTWRASLGLLIPLIGLWWVAPPINGFMQILTQPETYHRMLDKFLPIGMF